MYQRSAILVLSAMLIGCSGAQAPERALTLDVLKNLEYSVAVSDGKPVKLVNGRFDQSDPIEERFYVIATDSVGFGDFDGDGRDDAAIIIVSGTGGTGVFEDLALVLNEKNKPRVVSGVMLGDRVDVKGVTVRRGEVLVDLVQQGPKDPMCCPTERVTRRFGMSAGALSEIR